MCIFSQKADKISDENNYVLPGISTRYWGTYLPEKYIFALKRTYTHQLAMKEIKNMSDNYVINKNKISASGGYDDGYSISVKEYKMFDFNNFNKGYILDNNKNKYIYISSNVKEYNNEIIKSYILGIIFFKKEYINTQGDKLEVLKDSIKYNNEEYSLQLNSIYEPKDLDQYTSKTKSIGIEQTNNKIKIYELLPNDNDPGYKKERKLLSIFSK